MVNPQNKEKGEIIYKHLSDTALEIIKLFTTILKISEDDSYKLITSNISAITFLYLESGLKLYGNKKSLEILMRFTLYRSKDYDSPITDEELERVKNHYGFTITRDSSLYNTCQV